MGWRLRAGLKRRCGGCGGVIAGRVRKEGEILLRLLCSNITISYRGLTFSRGRKYGDAMDWWFGYGCNDRGVGESEANVSRGGGDGGGGIEACGAGIGSAGAAESEFRRELP